jgi:diaminopimelate epimerase
MRVSEPFEKWQGLGNHFVVLESLPQGWTIDAICHGQTGVGADGVLLVDPAPPRMTVFNADGSRASMCGNGLRCAARWFAERGVDLSQGIVTDSGTFAVRQVAQDVTVVVGTPQHLNTSVFEGMPYHHIDVGNPHAVFVDPVPEFDLERVGAAMQHHAAFPGGVNVHEVRTGSDTLIVGPFERGVGLTQACGTGAAASAYAVHHMGQASWPVVVALPGGQLTFDAGADGRLWMTGPASRVFKGLLDPR